MRLLHLDAVPRPRHGADVGVEVVRNDNNGANKKENNRTKKKKKKKKKEEAEVEEENEKKEKKKRAQPPCRRADGDDGAGPGVWTWRQSFRPGDRQARTGTSHLRRRRLLPSFFSLLLLLLMDLRFTESYFHL